MNSIFLWLLAANILGFLLFGIDKSRAKKGLWRIPEATLLGVALLGGSIGAYAGMNTFRHKTRKVKFVIGIPVIIVLQLASVIAYCWLHSF